MNKYSEEVLEICAKDYYTNTASLYCIIYHNQDNKIIGYCGINHFYREYIDIGIDILEDYQRSGYGFEALKKYFQVLNQCKKDEMEDVYANIEPDNVSSRKLFVKLGAQFEKLAFYDFLQEEAEAYEKSHLYLIDEELESLAAELCVAPEKLLTRVLVYRIDWDR